MGAFSCFLILFSHSELSGHYDNQSVKNTKEQQSMQSDPEEPENKIKNMFSLK